MPGGKPSDGTGAVLGSRAGGAAASTGRSGTIGALASAPHGQCCCTAPASWLPAFSSGIVIVPPGLAGSEQMRTVIDPPASLSIIQPGATSRSDERRGGKACVSTCRSRWSRYHKKKNTQNTTVTQVEQQD